MSCCIYCGDANQCRDHVIPVSVSASFRSYKPGATVPCCTTCNTLAGPFPATSVQQKAHHLIKRYNQRFRRVLSIKATREDAEAFPSDSKIRQKLVDDLTLKERIEAKLANLEQVCEGFDPVSLANGQPASARLPEKLCICGETFTPKRSFQIHCGPPCRVRSYWTRHEVVRKQEAGR